MVRQVAQPSTRPYASRQIGTAAAWMKHLLGRGILKAKFHEDCLECNMRTLSRASEGYISSMPPRLLTVQPACLSLD